MQIIIFLTNPDSLIKIDISFPWDDEKDVHQFEIIPDQHPAICLPNRQIWVVRDEIWFGALEQQLDMLPSLTEVYYVYHNFPPRDFIKQLDAYLAGRGIFKEGRQSRQIQNVYTLFEEIRRYPFTPADFRDITELISPCRTHISRMMNRLNDVNNVLENKINGLDFPEHIRLIYKEVMTRVTSGNFAQKRAELKKVLDKYCREQGKL